MKNIPFKIVLSILMLSSFAANAMYRMQKHATPLETTATAVRDAIGESDKYGQESHYYKDAQLIVAWAETLQALVNQHPDQDIAVDQATADTVFDRLDRLAKKVDMQNDITAPKLQTIGKSKIPQAIQFAKPIAFERHKSRHGGTAGSTGSASTSSAAPLLDAQNIHAEASHDANGDANTTSSMGNDTASDGNNDGDTSTSTSETKKSSKFTQLFQRKSSKAEAVDGAEVAGAAGAAATNNDNDTASARDESNASDNATKATSPRKKSIIKNPFKRKGSKPEAIAEPAGAAAAAASNTDSGTATASNEGAQSDNAAQAAAESELGQSTADNDTGTDDIASAPTVESRTVQENNDNSQHAGAAGEDDADGRAADIIAQHQPQAQHDSTVNQDQAALHDSGSGTSSDDDSGDDQVASISDLSSQEEANSTDPIAPQPAAADTSFQNQVVKLLQNKMVLTGGGALAAALLYYLYYCSTQATIIPRNINEAPEMKVAIDKNFETTHEQQSKKKSEIV